MLTLVLAMWIAEKGNKYYNYCFATWTAKTSNTNIDTAPKNIEHVPPQQMGRNGFEKQCRI